MEVVKGVVQQINVKEAREGQFGSWANYGIKVNDNWYNGALNADKKTGALMLKDKEYKEVVVGAEVEFLLVEKNGYKNIDGKSMSVIGSQQAPPPTTPPPLTEEPYTPTEEEAKVSSAISATIWAECLKSSVELLKLEYKNGNAPEGLYTKAINGANELFNNAHLK